MLDIGVLCNPDKTTIVTHNHKMDGPELEHWDQSGLCRNSNGFSQSSPTQSSDNVFLPGSARRRTTDQRFRRERALSKAQWRGQK